MNRLFFIPDVVLICAAVVAGVYHGIIYAGVVCLVWVILLQYRVIWRLMGVRESLRSLDLVVPLLNTIIGRKPGDSR